VARRDFRRGCGAKIVTDGEDHQLWIFDSDPDISEDKNPKTTIPRLRIQN
jgi:hypothetical protein